MARISIKPLSVNAAYRGRRFATSALIQYKKDLGYLLPKMDVPTGKLAVRYVFGLSSKGADGDNLIKAFQDCIADQYGFDDKVIYKWEIEKVDVKKGAEFIDFAITPFLPDTENTA